MESRRNPISLWSNWLDKELEKSYFDDIRTFLKLELRRFTICPSPNDIFNAYKLTNPNTVKVVIVGQDPYMQVVDGKPIANGLAFGTRGNTAPNSLKNIRNEICRDFKILLEINPNSGVDQLYLASQGLLLLNTYLTTRNMQSLSHTPENSDYQTLRIRWDIFTGTTIRLLSERRTNLVFILMGSEAHELGSNWLRNRSQHLIIETTHPTSKSFKYGNKPLWGSNFASITNNYLTEYNNKKISWLP